MKNFLSRRSMLAGIGYTAACGSVASQVSSVAQAADTAAPAAAAAPAAPQELVLSMLFMAGAKNKFDTKKYISQHLPLLKKSYGDSVSRIELRTSVGGARGIPSDILATTTIYIANLGEFGNRMRLSAPEVNKDLEDASKGARNIQVDRLVMAVGNPREDVRENHQVFSTFYRDKPDATFDTAYYTEVYIPKMRSLYGDNAIRRIEFNMGAPQGGTKPAIMASTHIFIRERSAYDSANGEAVKELMQTDVKYTNTVQMWADLKIVAVA